MFEDCGQRRWALSEVLTQLNPNNSNVLAGKGAKINK